MFMRTLSAVIHGLDVLPVEVEADIGDGMPQFVMVGSLSPQVREAQDRVKTAFRNNQIELPAKRITINLAPADIPKSGTGFDLPIALVLLAALKLIPEDSLTKVMAVGELSLSGTIHAVNGILPIAIKAKELGVRILIVPKANEREANIVQSLTAIGVSSLTEVISLLRGNAFDPPSPPLPLSDHSSACSSPDFSDILGQETAKRAAILSVAGFHNLLFIGPPGSGKSMIAKRIPTILPDLTTEESLELSKIYSIAGLLDPEHPLMTSRPFRSPHHTISPQALAGGGRIPQPGEITLSHHGVLFLDELPEFQRSTLEILRQPLEDHFITIARSSATYRYPANFLLLAAMNPCPCGYYPDHNKCTCSTLQISRYQSRLSKPLLDRIDLCVSVSPVAYSDLEHPHSTGMTSKEIRSMVTEIHRMQEKRFAGTGIHFNSEIPASAIETYCPMSPSAKALLKRAYLLQGFSARSYHRIIRVARTIADLDHSEEISGAHIAESISYKAIGKEFWDVHS